MRNSRLRFSSFTFPKDAFDCIVRNLVSKIPTNIEFLLNKRMSHDVRII